MNILIDFDGTCVTYVHPGVGEDIEAAPVLKRLVERNHNLILFTMRPTGDALDDAVNWFKKNNIPLFGIQTNPHQKDWTDSPKAYGDLIIDDTALGVPVVRDLSISDRPFVDWKRVEKILENMGLI